MAPPKGMAECPICLFQFRYLGKHLITKHKLRNPEERKLLLNLGSRRVNIRGLTCPIEGCGYSLSRLDTHLAETSHPEMEAGELAKITLDLKRRHTLQLLRDLRGKNPNPPMVSSLDLDPKEDEVREVREGTPCNSPYCKTRDAELVRLRKRCRVLAKSLRKSQKRVTYLEQQQQQQQPKQQHHQQQHQQQPEEAAGAPGLSLPATLPETSSEDDGGQDDLQPNQEARRSRSGGVLAPFRFLPRGVVQYMEMYWAHLHGFICGRKQKENQASKMTRIYHFLSFLANGQSWSTTWTVLLNVRRIYEWPDQLRKEGKAVTTVKAYFVNVTEFISYFKETPPVTSRVPKRSVVAVQRALTTSMARLGRRVALRQILIKRDKLRHLVPKRHLRACRTRCLEEIPRVLDRLEKESSGVHMRKFFALLALYVTCVYGHRIGVLTSMTVQEVTDAWKTRDEEQDEGFLINVQEHKTNRVFGSAKVFLTPGEFCWFQRWLTVRASLKPKTDLLIFKEGDRRYDKLLSLMQKQWSDMGLPGTPTVTDIRTSIATYARDLLSSDDRMVLSGIMCHDVSTAEKYYAVDRSCRQLATIRKMFDAVTDPDARCWKSSSSGQKGAAVVAAEAVGEEEEEDCRLRSQNVVAVDHYEEEVEATPSWKGTEKRAVEEEEGEEEQVFPKKRTRSMTIQYTSESEGTAPSPQSVTLESSCASQTTEPTECSYRSHSTELTQSSASESTLFPSTTEESQEDEEEEEEDEEEEEQEPGPSSPPLTRRILTRRRTIATPQRSLRSRNVMWKK